MTILLLTLIIAFLATYITLPHIITIAEVNQLGAVPNQRSSHTKITPVFGGIGILAGILSPLLILGKLVTFQGFSLIFVAVGVVFLMGLKDDFIEIKPLKKLLGQIVAASLVVISGLQIGSLHGIFGVGILPNWFAIPLTIFVIIVIMNAFNLIDGINGLSSGIGILVATVLGIWFYRVGELEFSMIAIALVGALLAFLKFNITPAKIFMGDSGSLVLGLIVSILIIHFIDFHQDFPGHPLTFTGVPAIAISILIFPLFDTLRVFTVRILKGRSPLSPDRHHIHHMLIDAGFTHTNASLILVMVNAIYILLAMTFQALGPFILLTLVLSSCIGLTLYLRRLVRINRLKNPPIVARKKERSTPSTPKLKMRKNSNPSKPIIVNE